MIKNYQPARRVTRVRYELEFLLEGQDYGYGFPCDIHGKMFLHKLQTPAIKNLFYCLNHPERFDRRRVRRIVNAYTVPATGECTVCGHRIDLWNEYLGACECPHCGQWYNLFGQHLLPPDMWED